jgi:hypothetical protein
VVALVFGVALDVENNIQELFLFSHNLFSHNFKQYSRFLDKVNTYFGLFPQ